MLLVSTPAHTHTGDRNTGEFECGSSPNAAQEEAAGYGGFKKRYSTWFISQQRLNHNHKQQAALKSRSLLINWKFKCSC